MLAAGLFRVGQLTLRPNTRLIGAARQSVLEFTGGAAFITAHEAPGVRLESLVVDGSLLGMDAALGTGLISISNSDGISLIDLDVRRGLMNGIALHAMLRPHRRLRRAGHVASGYLQPRRARSRHRP